MAKKKLAAYQAKRDFEKTSEPRGTAKIRKAEYPRFVIQKHDATRLHYDLRLEMDGVFKSWAVTRGPSLDPHDKRLAVEVEEHPLDYGDFEGTIPKGEYGGGTVMLWDRGFWMPEGTDDIDAALRKGELKFTLAGGKLQGSWVLVRIKNDRDRGKRNNWLLIKHRDAFAREGGPIIDQDRSVASGRSMQQIAAGKGRGPKPFMAAGAAVSAPTAVWHSGRAARSTGNSKPAVLNAPASLSKTAAPSTGPMPRFVAPQLCKELAKPPEDDDWIHEIKFDGYRMQLRVEHGTAALRTRTGLEWTDKFAAIAKAAARLPDCMIDGEVVVLDAKGAPSFALLQAALSESRSQDFIYFAFDLLFLRGEDVRPLPLSERKHRLRQLLSQPGLAPLRYVEHFAGSGDAVLRSARQMHLEGIVSKRPSAPYSSGRTSTWTKVKTRTGHEVVIGGWSGTATTLRALIAGVYRGHALVHVGQVGTGFNARNTKALLKKLNANKTAASPFRGKTAPSPQADWNWVKPVLVAEIAFAGWTGAGMVRQAAFKGLREDKPAAEVKAERPAAPGDVELATSAKLKSRAVAKPPAVVPSVVGDVTLSNPEKALWPAWEEQSAVTKRDLANYLEEVGPWMIEHLKGRPCSLIRAPDGIGAQTFFQRHAMPGVSDLVALTTVAGDRKPYLQIDRTEGLIAMAQIAAVEFHPWNCAPYHPAVPGRLVFDLDPAPEVAFSEVIAAAKELRDRLHGLGLVAFCKTTGGKGLHVVTPLKTDDAGGLQWHHAKTFAQAVCAHMAHDSPDKYLIEMSKKRREGRIFLDYLRNDRMATAVAPLSPRARPGAPVSMPLDWNQVRQGLDPKRFTLKTVPTLLANSKAWAGYCSAQRKLKPAIEKLVRK